MLNSNIYSQRRGAADLVGAAQRGLTIGEMLRRRKQKEYDFKKQEEQDKRAATVRDIFKQNFKADENGKFSLDREATMGQLASTDPQAAMKLQQQWSAQDQAAADREMALADRSFDRNYKKQMMGLKEKEANSKLLKEKNALLEKRNKKREEEEALMVPGYGKVRTKKEAQELRAAQSDAKDAMGLIDNILDLSKDGVNILERDKVAKIEQMKKVLAGKLRLPLTGPGAMTEDEYKRLIDTMGDPSNLFGLESIEKGKLSNLKNILNDSVLNKFQSSGAGGFAKFTNPKGWDLNPETGEIKLKKKISDYTDQELDMLEQLESMRQGTAYAK